MKRLLALILFLLAAISASHGESIAGTAREPRVSVVTGSTPDFKKLVGRIFKGVREDPESHDLVTAAEKTLRQPDTKERTILPEGVHLGEFEAIRVRGDGRRYLVVFFKAQTDATFVPGNGAAILAVFQEGSAEPLDVAEVKSDVFCGLASSLFPIGSDDAFTITNSHHNSSQGYLSTSLFHVRKGRLQKIADVFTLRYNVLCEESFNQTPAWRTEKDGDKPHPKLIATVTLTMGIGEDEGGDCSKDEKNFRTEVFSETRRWDKAKDRYVIEGKGFDALDRFNREHL